MSFFALLSLLLVLHDVNGIAREPLVVKQGKANALFFVTTDCPISNSFAPEIARICSEYASKGVNCELIYVDPATTNAQAKEHASEYRYGDYPRIVDRLHAIVKATGAVVTPEAAVIDRSGKVAYLGRIDDSAGALGQPRRPAKTHDLRDALNAVIADQIVEHPRTKALGCYISDLMRQ